MTVRKALDELVSERIIQRRQGIGSFVISKTPSEFLYSSGNIVSIIDYLASYGITATFKTLTVAVLVPPPRERELLMLAENVVVAHISRLVVVADQPILLASSYLAPQYNEILNMDLTRPCTTCCGISSASNCTTPRNPILP